MHGRLVVVVKRTAGHSIDMEKRLSADERFIFVESVIEYLREIFLFL